MESYKAALLRQRIVVSSSEQAIACFVDYCVPQSLLKDNFRAPSTAFDRINEIGIHHSLILLPLHQVLQRRQGQFESRGFDSAERVEGGSCGDQERGAVAGVGALPGHLHALVALPRLRSSLGGLES